MTGGQEQTILTFRMVCKTALATSALFASTGKDEIGSGALLSGNRDFHGLLTVFFMHSDQRVFTRGQVLDLERSIQGAHGEVRMRQHVYVHLHPGMLVALHRNHELRMLKGFYDWISSGDLALIPCGIIFGHGMDIVLRGVCIKDLERLAHHETEHMR